MQKFNEATRVQIPAMIHLARLGYDYVGKITNEDASKEDALLDVDSLPDNNKVFDPTNNILLNFFKKQFERLNQDCSVPFNRVFGDLRQSLRNDDLGSVFYNNFIQGALYKCIDFENVENNVFSFTAEFACRNRNGDDQFRPDITLFVNGLPLCFIEVKKPNNKGGVVAEQERMNKSRFPNKKFRTFFNITQLMIFSNNMEYDSQGGITPIQGAFYCTTSYTNAPFNCFREEMGLNKDVAPFHANFDYLPDDIELKNNILRDFNAQVIDGTPEFKTNLSFNTPTNRILTSMCSKERLLFLLKYGIAYVNFTKEVNGQTKFIFQKHVIRYQQMFACFAIKDKLSNGAKSGVVWHTQGSGKTALSFFLHRYLTDYYSKQGKLAKFYFIVDRLDLLEQASQEFTARGLEVHTARDRAALMREFRLNQAYNGASGKPEISVVNIQRFKEDTEAVEMPEYDSHIQRIFILDEAHRGYKPSGSFLANLFAADDTAIKIALTGTPLLKEECASSKVFSTYFHTYYYNSSLADGYTLKLIREDIQTEYKEQLNSVYESLSKAQVQKKEVRSEQIFTHHKYVESLCDYIEQDFRDFRVVQNDNTIGGMIVCASSEQARAVYKSFKERENKTNSNNAIKAELVLYDSADKDEQKSIVANFKYNMTVDILIVFNMLLTGFDAPRLKRLYLGRSLKDHTLLQALTRVNRPYKEHKYGYIVDFADIKSNFEKTNEAYLRELEKFNSSDLILDGEEGSGLGNNFLVNNQEIVDEMKKIHNYVFDYSFDNMELFSQEISQIDEKEKLLQLRANLIQARDFANIVRTFGDDTLKEQFAKLTFSNLNIMLKEVQSRIDLMNQKDIFQADELTLSAINQALMFIDFTFTKLSQQELTMIDGGSKLKEQWNKLVRDFSAINDQDNPEFISLKEAFHKRFKDKGFVISSVKEYRQTCYELDDLSKRLNAIHTKELQVLRKVKDDVKYLRLYNKILSLNNNREESNQPKILSGSKEDIFAFINNVKDDIDGLLIQKKQSVNNSGYFSSQVSGFVTNRLITQSKDSRGILEDSKVLSQFVADEYLNQHSAFYSS